MKRYCIGENVKAFTGESNQHKGIITGHDKLHLHMFTLGDILLYNSGYDGLRKGDACDGSPDDTKMCFPECRDEMIKIMELSKECKEITDIEEDMYGDILFWDLDEEVIELDVCMHIYYTILYQENEEKYISFMKEEWQTEIKDGIRKGRKDQRKYQKNSGVEKAIPFEIKEKVEDSIKIQDFAPEISRLYYISREFRNIFKHVKDEVASKYKYANVIDIFKNSQNLAPISRIEEIWLCERVLGFNLANTWYSFFYNILKGIEFETIKNEYEDIIILIIKEVMKWSGIYSQNLLIERLKLICEIKYESNRRGGKTEISPKELLDYVYKRVLCVYISEDTHFEEAEERLYRMLKNDIEGVKGRCLELKDRHLSSQDGYYMLKRSGEVKKPQDNFANNLFALIQKNVIENL